MDSYNSLAEELSFHRAGETVDIVVYRSGEYVTLSVTFGSAPAESSSVPA